MRGKLIILILVTLVIIYPLSGCTSQGSDTPDPSQSQGNKDSLVVVMQAEPKTLDPHRIDSAPEKEILFNVYEGLVGVSTQGEIIPVLANDWSISEDGKTYTFYLKENVQFHNGAFMTATDVKASLERLQSTDHPYYSNFQDIIDIKVQDSQTVVIDLAEPFAPFLANLALVTSAIVPADAIDTLDQEPVGTGPFKFESWEPTQKITFTRFDNYWEADRPYLEKLEFHLITDSFAALQALQAGTVDVVPRIESDAFASVEANEDLKLESSPQNLVQLLAINNARTPFTDVRVRQALNFAIDKQAIIDVVLQGKGTEIASNMSPVMGEWYKDLNDVYTYDPERARVLLEEAGYADGFSCTLTVPTAWQQHIDTAIMIKDQLAEIGINVEIEQIEFGIWLERAYMGRDYDLTVIGFDGKPDPHQLLEYYLSDNTKNFMNFNDAEFDRLMEQGMKLEDTAERIPIYHQLQTILTDKAAAVYIQDMDMTVAMRANVQGWKFYPIYVIDAKDVRKE